MLAFKERCKYSPFLEYGKNIEKIILKKKYEPEIAEMLRLSVPIMIEYYGDEYKSIFFNVLQNVNIEIVRENETIFDIVKRYAPKNIEEKAYSKVVTEGELKRAEGVYSTYPVFNLVNGKIILNNKTNVVGIRTDTNKLATLSTFIHELSHAFKSSANSMSLNKDSNESYTLLMRSGISFLCSKAYIENGKIILEDIEEKNIGLEESINIYDENNIIDRILFLSSEQFPESCKALKTMLMLTAQTHSYNSGVYSQEISCVDKLLTQCKLNKVIRQDQFLGTYDSEEEYNKIANTPKNTWENLNARLNQSVKDSYDRYKNAFNVSWIMENANRIISNLRSIYDMLDECSINIEKEVKLKDET